MHHDIDTIERMEIIRDLRLGEFDVLVGINLLREGLDLPEVSLVAILDADKEGFLRSETSLIQTIGRAARNAEGQVIMYADTITDFHGAGASGRRSAAGPSRMAYNEAPRHHPQNGVQKRAGCDRDLRGTRAPLAMQADSLQENDREAKGTDHTEAGQRI